ncbi:MAG: translation initiation factor IF-2 [Phycisphaerales bacterium]
MSPASHARGPARGKGAGGGGGGDEPARPSKRRGMNARRGRGGDVLPTGPTKFSQADMEELDARLSGATGFLKQRRRNLRKSEHTGQAAQSAVVTGGKVEVQEPITIKALSAATGIKAADVMKYMFKKGVMATINSAIDTEAAMEVALEYDIELEVKEQQTAEQIVEQEFAERDSVDVRPRPPVVTVLGHVDHGKTSLLDKIRQADVAAHEAGGITQHVGAYRVTVKGGDNKDKTVVFLDTPGHEAFTSMRARGAGMTDLVVLVCAADDGVMPQTIESINHAKAAGVPIIVALNKSDLPQATEENVHKIYGQLAEHGLNPTEWGGDTEVIKTSAHTGMGIQDLLEVLDYQAELLELKADYGGPARGAVIEAEMQSGRGSVARVLVQDGQIKVGDFIVIGRAFGRVRDMTNDRDQKIDEAGPATPLELSGIDAIPDAGDKFYVTQTLQKAESVAQQYRDAERQKMLASQTKVTLDNFAATIKAGQANQLRVVVKADVQGSMDVLRKSLEKLGNDEVNVKVIHAAVGGVTENDVLLADASDAIVIGFHVVATSAVKEIAEARGVDIRLYRVIYDVTDDVNKALEGMLSPETKEDILGQAEVKQVFKIGKVGMIAGCVVTEGTFQKSGRARLERDGVVITDNREVESLRRVKDDAKEVRSGTECGIRLKGFDDLKPGDTIVCYKVKQVKRTLE